MVRNKSREQNEEDKLSIVCRAVRDSFPDIECDFKIAHADDIPGEIVAASTRYGTDLIVMGTKGLTNFEKMVFGSNTATVIERSGCPVLSVPHQSTFTKPKKVLFATNFERDDIHSAMQILQLAKAFNATLILGHVLVNSNNEESERRKMQHFTRELSILSDYPRIGYRLANENTVTMGLDVLIENTQADVIAMSTHKRRLLEKILNPSITQKFAEESQIPLLAFHAF